MERDKGLSHTRSTYTYVASVTTRYGPCVYVVRAESVTSVRFTLRVFSSIYGIAASRVNIYFAVDSSYSNNITQQQLLKIYLSDVYNSADWHILSNYKTVLYTPLQYYK